MIHHLTRATKHLIFWSLIVFAIALSLIRFILSVIDVYPGRSDYYCQQRNRCARQNWALRGSMRGFRPELLLKDVQVLAATPQQRSPHYSQRNPSQHRLLRSYGKAELLASSWISLVGASMVLHRGADGHIDIEGLKRSEDEPPYWLLHTAQVEIVDSEIVWRDDMIASAASTKSPKPAPEQHFKAINILLKNDQDGQKHLLNTILTLPKPLWGSHQCVNAITG